MKKAKIKLEKFRSWFRKSFAHKENLSSKKPLTIIKSLLASVFDTLDTDKDCADSEGDCPYQTSCYNGSQIPPNVSASATLAKINLRVIEEFCLFTGDVVDCILCGKRNVRQWCWH